MRAPRVLALALLALGGLGGAAPEAEPAGGERTPPRLAWTQGEPSFLRAGAEGWAPARVNLPLAPGDRLRTGEGGALEIQLGPRDYLRAASRTELGVENQQPDFLQLRVGAGIASLDLRSLPAGHAIEVGTPQAAFTIEMDGDYRIAVGEDATTFTSRRGGRATLARTAGPPLDVGANEQVVVRGEGGERAERHAAPERDAWDRWSSGRSEARLEAISTRYAGGVYGASDLDEHGDWSTLEPYGPIWIPRVHVDWAPYSAGRWIWDPHFAWSWLDDSPWGWAPFHYGRWIFVHGRWAWVPGPLGPRLIYAPALVAFYGSHRTTVLWVPLGWGEPIRPWWGPRRWIGQPHWLGWSGPRITAGTYANARLQSGAIAVPGEAFGRSPVQRVRTFGARPGELRLVHGALPVERRRVSYVGAEERVATPPASLSPVPRLVPAPRFEPPRRPPLGTGTERLAPGRVRAPAKLRPGQPVNRVPPPAPAPGGIRGPQRIR